MTSNSSKESSCNPISLDLVNIMASCRACLVKSDNMTDISSSSDITRQIEFCTGVLVKTDDHLPMSICIDCHNKLTTAYKFKQTFLQADSILREINSIKTEQCDYRLEDKAAVHEDADIKHEPVINIEVESDGCADDNLSDTEKTTKSGKSNAKSIIRKSGRLKGKLDKLDKVDKSVKLEGSENKNLASLKKKKRLRQLKYKKLFCEPCKIQFKDSTESKTHRKEIHDKGVFICEHCGRQFSNRATHYSHVKSHQPPRFGCSTCDYRAVCKQSILNHVKIHTGVKHYQCEYCTAAYYNLSNLKVHIKRRHLNPVPRHQCTLCDRRFHDRTKLNRHIDSHNEVKRFQCEHCHSAFTRRCYWKKHLLQQHSVVTPAQRPGRRRTSCLVENPEAKIMFISKDEVCSKLSVGVNKSDDVKASVRLDN